MNLKALGEAIGLEEDEYRELAELFLETGRIDYEALHAACQTGDAETVSRSTEDSTTFLFAPVGRIIGNRKIHIVAKPRRPRTGKYVRMLRGITNGIGDARIRCQIIGVKHFHGQQFALGSDP